MTKGKPPITTLQEHIQPIQVKQEELFQEMAFQGKNPILLSSMNLIVLKTREDKKVEFHRPIKL